MSDSTSLSDSIPPSDLTTHIASDLALLESGGLMVPAGHEAIVKKLQENLPAVLESSKNFGKRQSEFMNSMLTVTQPTPIRRARQCCSEIEASWGALREHYFKRKKQELKIQSLELDIDELEGKIKTVTSIIELDKAIKSTRPRNIPYNIERLIIKRDRKQLKIEKLLSNNEHAEKFISGAMRRVAQLSQQYKDILKAAGKERFTEADFEEEEVEYHIKTAYLQGLTAARAHGGQIDEGNHIYLQQIGVNGMMAQKAVTELLEAEKVAVDSGFDLDMEKVWKWLDERFEAHKEDVQKFAKMKGQVRTYLKELTIGIEHVTFPKGLKSGDEYYLNAPEKHS